MIRFLLILLLSFVLSCNTSKKENSQSYFVQTDVYLDTVVEKNSPTNLDLSKHQLYIDTSRTNTGYNFLQNWSLKDFDYYYLNNFLKEVHGDYEIKSFDIQGFNREWIKLRKFQNQFVLYNRCNGSDFRYGISDSTVLLISPLEGDVWPIEQLISVSENEINLKIHSGEPDSISPWFFKIDKTNFENVYLMTSTIYGDSMFSLVTPKSKLKSFDMVVSNCIGIMINDRIQFDSIDYSYFLKT